MPISYHTMLGVHPLLNQLLVTHLKELNAKSQIYDSGDFVIKEQQHADDILLLKSGELSVEIGAQRELARIKPGELLGEMGLSGDNRHCATVRVLHGPAEIIRVNADALLRLALFDGDLALEWSPIRGQHPQSAAKHQQPASRSWQLPDRCQAAHQHRLPL